MNMKTLMRSILSRVTEAAPIASLALVLLFSLVAAPPEELDAAAMQRQSDVQRAIESAPYRIGRWVGTDMPVPPAAIRLLRPNAILSRQFRPLDGGPGMELLIVNCGNARDMLGHYPPVCYPSAGWIPAPDAPTQLVALSVGGHPVPASQYEFLRMIDSVREMRVRVLNFFILPDGQCTHAIDAVNEQAEQLGISMQGVTQVQLIMPAAMPPETSRAAAGDVLDGMTSVLVQLGFDPGADDATD